MKNYVFILSLFAALILPKPSTQLLAQGMGFAHVPAIVERIQERRGTWIGFKANLTLQFSNSKSQAACSGELTYHRLDEKVLLHCFDEEKNLLFTFKTDDRHFHLFIPSQQTVFHGGIFDLKENPKVDIHLKPQDLYRALKPALFVPEQAYVKDQTSDLTTLSIFSDSNLSRVVQVTNVGDVSKEIFYSIDQEQETVIERTDFRQNWTFDQTEKTDIIYPGHMMIESSAKPNKTELQFHEILFLSKLNDAAWQAGFPDGVEFVAIDEPAPTSTKAVPVA